MKRISTPTKVTDKFGPGKHGFRNGDAVAGIVATDLEADIFDHLQEELCAVIEAAGIAIDGSARNQLLSALRSAGVFQTPGVGDRSTKVATTQMFANEFASSLTANGYQKLPSGLLIQWGTGVSLANGTKSFSFPIAFPTACVSITATRKQPGSNAVLNVGATSVSQFSVQDFAGGNENFNWMAVGY